ncbi:RHS repeat-associated core domain-containing protein [Nonomuraea sp. 3N208]|uniref:RHS repeat-associated core domain-containing protein n=1 Tax=Nonomuraea sp. 3N208 TaxID=3457421 RepID=UPI003FD045EE
MRGWLNNARWSGRRVLWIVVPLALTLIAQLLAPTPASTLAKPRGADRPTTQRQPSVKTSKVAFRPGHMKAPAGAQPKLEGSWPEPGVAVADVGTATGQVARGSAPAAQAGTLPVSVRAASAGTGAPADKPSEQRVPGKVRVELLDQKASAQAGVYGVLLKVGAAEVVSTPGAVAPAAGGKASVTLDYSAFRGMGGAGWAQRLRLVRLPDCALTRPGSPDCQPQSLATSRNDASAHTLSADVDLPPAGAPLMLAAVAGASGPAGDFAATSLSPSATWQVSNQSGAFSWSYPVRTPPAVSGPSPKIGLSYSSGSVDGRTSSTNNQTSWLGEGFDYWPGYIERKFKSCSDDGQTGNPPPGDQCWGGENATMSLNGSATELVRDDKTGVWRPKDDDGSTIEKLSGVANGDQGDNENLGEHWRVTTADGTQYYFGMNRLPNWVSGKPETKSTWTVPVAGNDSGEPCHKSTGFGDTFCNQAWRWNLDYVVDPRGNAMSLWYDTETNYYAKNKVAKPATPYIRGGYLTRIDYGQTKNTIYSAKAPYQVVFDVRERCFKSAADCADSKFTEANRANWPDIPVDQNCSKDATCGNKFSPTFWTRKRLAGITTQVLNGTAYKPVDSWVFGQTIVAAGDTSDPSLRLNGITHTGKATGSNVVGGDVSLPSVTFGYSQMPNRVDGIGDGMPAFIKWRLTGIQNEHGGGTNITYSPIDCTKSSLPSPESNTRYCFPQRVGRPGATDPHDLITDWLHKYVVTEVNEADYVGDAPAQITQYKYLDKPAWRFADDDALVPARLKTWSQWRGHSKVQVLHGAPHAQQTRTDYLYFRGMDGDRAKADGSQLKPPVKLVDSEDDPYADHDHRQGMLLESIQYKDKTGNKELSATINTPWEFGPTATHGSVKAYKTDVGRTRTRTALSNGFRRTEVLKEFNNDGTIKQQWDKGDTGSSVGDSDDLCTQYTYTGNATAGIWGLNNRTWTVSKPCGQSATLPADAVSDVKTTFDLTYGEPTKTEEADGYTGGNPTYVTTSRTVYDGLGRISETYDGLGNKTTTGYTAPGGVVTARTTTNALNQASTQTMEPAWGLPTVTTDTNGNTSTLHYDALGRLIKAWGPGRATDKAPTGEFAYLVSKTAATAITSKELMPNGQQRATYQLFDGLLRPRQAQGPSSGTGRVLTDVYYDDRGLAWKTNHRYLDTTGQPGTTLLKPVQDNSVPSQTLTTYDGAGRPIVSTLYSFATRQWESSTSYGGDRTTTTPPRGGVLATTITNARGKPVELRQYKNGAVSDDPADYDATKYAYTSAGELSTVTDAVGNQWKYTYDLRGNKKTVEHPDRGLTKIDYNAAGGVAKTTDAENRTLKFSYDPLGRKTFEHQVAADGTETKLAEWTYDTVAGGKGMPAKSIRWSGGQAYTQEITKYDAAYRPLESQVTIPTTEGNLGKTYQTKLTYKADGSPATLAMPAAGELGLETVSFGYNALGQATTVAGLDAYAQGASYTDFGELSQLSLATFTSNYVFLTNYYDGATRRLTRSRTDRETINSADDDVNYTYDPAGNITKIADTPKGGVADVQCFSQDRLQRLTQAWTATDDCAQAPTKDNAGQVIGGPQPYWQSFGYDATGNRTKSVDHDVTGVTTKDRTSTYAYDGDRKGQPHTLTSLTTTWGGEGVPESGTATSTYTYDKTGNTTTRKVGGDDQTLVWDAEGQLSQVTEPDGNGGTKTSTYLYDANGNLLIRRDSDGTRTLFLDGQELKLNATGTVTGTRYYSHNGNVIAVRTAKGLSWLIPNRQGSAQLAIDAKTQQVVRRRYMPFGRLRTNPVDWPGTKSFIGGTPDPNTSMIHLGAREYDPETGRFASADPIVDHGSPQQMNGYAYANNNPVTLSDPTGLSPCHRDGSQCEEPGSPGNGTGAGKGVGKDRHSLRQGDYDHKYGNSYETGRGGSSDAEAAAARRQRLEAAARAMRERVAKAQSRIANAAATLAKIAADELGITAGLDCLTKGDIGACGETIVNVLSSAVGGLAGKLLSKYALRWGKAASLIKRLWSAVKDIAGGIKDWFAARRGLKIAEAAVRTARAAEAASSCRNSFTPGTKVRLANGTTKPIEKIKPGDKVLATDPKTGKTQAKAVVAAFSGTRYNNIVGITVDIDGERGQRTGVIHATEHHLFWNAGAGSWIRADQLHAGTLLRSLNGSTSPVVSVAGYASGRTVHDFTVADTHTYYVLAGETPVLVHNSGGCPPLKNLHPDSSLDRSSLDFWHNQDTEDIVLSLRPGLDESLKVTPDGTIMNGNTRVTVLRSRGYDVDSLPREPYGGNPMTDEDFWDMDQ